MRNIVSPKGCLNSIYPCTVGLTFNPWIYMVPQYRPNSVLILGYGGGTTAGLIKLFYGDVPITGVDNVFYENPYAVEFIKMDARDYVKNCEGYDVTIIDLWNDDVIADFITKESFVNHVKRCSNYIILHAPNNFNVDVYGKTYKTIDYDKNKFYYFINREIPQMGCFR